MITKLNKIYKQENFEWTNSADRNRNIITFERVYKTKKFEIADKEDVIEVDLIALSVRFFKLEK